MDEIKSVRYFEWLKRNYERGCKLYYITTEDVPIAESSTKKLFGSPPVSNDDNVLTLTA